MRIFLFAEEKRKVEEGEFLDIGGAGAARCEQAAEDQRNREPPLDRPAITVSNRIALDMLSE